MSGTLQIERLAPDRVRLSGTVGFTGVKAALARSEELLDRGGELKLDAAGLEGIDSATLALLLAWAARAAARGMRLEVERAPPALHALAQLCQVEGLLGISAGAAS